MTSLLRVNGLVKKFSEGGPRAVDGLSFGVAQGEIVALLGPSGCGKTTTLRLIAGLEPPDAGTIALAGARLDGGARRVPPERRGIGLVFQDYALFPHLSALENVMFGLRGARERRRRAARDALRRVGLADLKERNPHTLSGGQKQRVALARALAPRPSLLLLDEPFSNLDATLRDSTRDEVRAILKDAGMTALLVTHDQEEALSLADRVAVMRAGRIDQMGDPEAIYHRPKNRFVAQFLGRANLLAGEARGDAASTELGEVALVEPATGPVLLSLRPEHLSVSAERESGTGTPAEIESREFRGSGVCFRVRAGETRILVYGHHASALRPGDRVFVRARDPAVVLADDGLPDGG